MLKRTCLLLSLLLLNTTHSHAVEQLAADNSGSPPSGDRVDGNWSEWTPWSECSITCGDKGGVRTHYRYCNNPPPMNGGTMCVGEGVEREPCRGPVRCPVAGGWSAWGPWLCTKTCGGGVYYRERACDSPPPLFGGSCTGEGTAGDEAASREERAEPCSTFSCPESLSVHQRLSEAIDREFERNGVAPTTLFVQEMQKVEFHCTAEKATWRMIQVYLKAKALTNIKWRLNGNDLDKSITAGSRVNTGTTDGKLSIKHARMPQDNGIWSCELELDKWNRRLLSVRTLIVTDSGTNKQTNDSFSNAAVMIAELGAPIQLKCNIMPLALVFPDTAHVAWWFNNTQIYRSYNTTPASAHPSLTLPAALPNMTGVWECRLFVFNLTTLERQEAALGRKKSGFINKLLPGGKKDEDKQERIAELRSKLQRINGDDETYVFDYLWTTQRLRLLVKPRTPVWQRLMSSAHFGAMLAGFTLMSLAVFCSAVCGKFGSMMRDADVKMKRLDEMNKANTGNPATLEDGEVDSGSDDEISGNKSEVEGDSDTGTDVEGTEEEMEPLAPR